MIDESPACCCHTVLSSLRYCLESCTLSVIVGDYERTMRQLLCKLQNQLFAPCKLEFYTCTSRNSTIVMLQLCITQNAGYSAKGDLLSKLVCVVVYQPHLCINAKEVSIVGSKPASNSKVAWLSHPMELPF